MRTLVLALEKKKHQQFISLSEYVLINFLEGFSLIFYKNRFPGDSILGKVAIYHLLE